MIFAIVAAVVMVIVMLFDYEWWKQRARTLYVLTVIALFGMAVYSRASGTTTLAVDVGPIQIQPAEFAKFVVLLAMCAYLSEDRTPGEGVSYPRFLGSLIIVGLPAVLIIVQPDLGTGSVLIAMTMGVLLVAGAKARYIATISLMSVATIAAAYFARLVQRVPAGPHPGVLRREQPRPAEGRVPGRQRGEGRRHRRHLRQGVAEGSAHQRPRHPGHLGRLPVRRPR